ncbi:MAG: MFS transporter [Symplocastrum torsivum CPER-KK1]|jgi:fucose permease|uniref:MFS transporter n=1 Tax=Symplocastrum torsivum CPER-KK1 TaxID=450513 RepID=A0A951U9E1_9CYAN|nr:MFS transporter [Symplocastrum torsivum CPER-KK1]
MQQRPRLALICLAYIGFISLGLPDGLLGVAWPSIRTSFSLSLDALGSLLVASTAGYTLSSFNSGRILARISVGVLLSLSAGATAISLLGYAIAPSWWVLIGFGFLSGLGAGAIDSGLNTYVATHFSPRILNWLHASYGIGTTTGPLIMTSVLDANRPWQWGYLIVATVQLLLTGCFAVTRDWWRVPHTASSQSPSADAAHTSTTSTLCIPVVWIRICVFFMYAGVEVSVGQWTYSLFTQTRSISTTIAGQWVSLYWGSFTVGRVFFGAIANRAPINLLLRLCMTSAVIGATLIWLNIANFLTMFGLMLIGFSLAPIFPSLIATTPESVGRNHVSNTIGFQVAAATVGVAVLPSLAGVLSRYFGLEIVSIAICVETLFLFVLFEILVRQRKIQVTEETINS